MSAAASRFNVTAKPVTEENKLNKNSSAYPQAVLISSFAASRIGAVMIFSRTKIASPTAA
jgi:hypothetical protein